MDNSGPAFPYNKPHLLFPADLPDEWKQKIREVSLPENGLTRRELFAAMAMQGILANSEFLRSFPKAYIDQAAIKFADSLLDSLEGKHELERREPSQSQDDSKKS